MFSEKNLKLITQILLLSVIVITLFSSTSNLYFPYISGKVYVFRLLVSLAFFFWVWLMVQDSRFKIKDLRVVFKNILVVAVVLFFLAQVLVSFFGVDPLLSFFSSIDRGEGVLQYGFWVLYCLMIVSVFKKQYDWKLFFYVFIIVTALLSIYEWLVYYTPNAPNVRLGGLFGNSSYLAALLLFAIGFCAIAIERRFINNRLNYLFFIPAAIFIITLIFTQTRGAYLGLVAGILLFCLLAFLFLRKENKRLALFSGLFLAIGVISVIALFLAKDSNFVQNTYILKRATSVANLWEDDTVRERLLVWQIALKAFKEKPIFGWGPENFGSAANKYYDYRVGMREPWFDRAHNQPIDILATGGIVLFSFYLFWLVAVVYIIFRISREKKILSFILASIFLAYFLQGLFLFDILPTYLGLFPFLAYIAYLNPKSEIRNPKQITNFKSQISNKFQAFILGVTAVLSGFLIYTTVFLPYKANASALKFYIYMENRNYPRAKSFLEQSYAIKSPYTFWEVRKKTSWELASFLDDSVDDKTNPNDISALKEIYDYMIPELKRFAENRRYDPQMYYILGRFYRLGFEKLGKNDLDKAESVLNKGFNFSESRTEYINELVRVLILEGRFEKEEENLIKRVKRISPDNYFSYIILGNLYFVAGKYDLMLNEYEKAREAGYKFYEDHTEYTRYMLAAEKIGEYQKVVDMAKNYLERWGPDADTYYNIAIGHLNLGEKEKAREFFLKAVELKKEYEEYRPFFEF